MFSWNFPDMTVSQVPSPETQLWPLFPELSIIQSAVIKRPWVKSQNLFGTWFRQNFPVLYIQHPAVSDAVPPSHVISSKRSLSFCALWQIRLQGCQRDGEKRRGRKKINKKYNSTLHPSLSLSLSLPQYSTVSFKFEEKNTMSSVPHEIK